MKKRVPDKFWFPWWPDKWIFGSVRIEFTPAERGMWVDLLSLASKDNGHIRANEETPYPLQQLAGMLIIPEKELASAIDKFIEKTKLTKMKDGTLYVTKWDKYQFSRTTRFYAEKGRGEQKGSHSEQESKEYSILNNSTLNNNKLENNIELRNQIIDYFNETTNQKRSYTCDGTNKLINGRLNEGRTIDDFKHVIDTKYTQWKNDKKMSQFIRPSTLFRPENFENYLNEPYENPKKKTLKVGESSHAPSKKEDDYSKARAIKMKELQKQHQLEIDKAMKAHASDWLDEIDNKIKEEIAEFSRKYQSKEEK